MFTTLGSEESLFFTLAVFIPNKMEFNLSGSDYIELKNLLKVVGFVDNGAAAKEAITNQEVTVDGQIETRKACKIKSGQIVEYKGKSIKVIS